MGNENERKHNPAENREGWMGGPDSAKGGGGNESNVGLTGAAGGGGGIGAGSGGVIGGSADFLTDAEPSAETGQGQAPVGGQQSQQNEYGAQDSDSGGTGFGAKENQQNLSGQQGGDSTFGGSGSGSSFMASNTGQSDLGSAGVGAGDQGQRAESDEPAPGDLASEDALDQERDGGTGVASGSDA